MQKSMTAKFNGKCALSGAPIYRGDNIIFDTVTRKAWLSEPGDCAVDTEKSDYLARRTRTGKNYISDVYSVNGREYYRNKRGLCVDAPCCGCCTV